MDQLATIFQQLASSAANAQGGLLEEALPAAFGAGLGRGVAQRPGGSKPPGIANSGHLQGGAQAAACNDDEWEAVQLLSALQDRRAPATGKPFGAGQQQHHGGQQGAQQLSREAEQSIDDIATQLISAFPEFAELLQTRNVPQQPAAQQQQHHAPPQEHQLDAQQQLLLQQLIAGVTQQQEQEQGQQDQEAALTAMAQEQLALLQKQQRQQPQQQRQPPPQQGDKSLQQMLAQQQQSQSQQQQLLAQLLAPQQGTPDAANARGAQQQPQPQQQQQSSMFTMRGAGGLAVPGEQAHTAQRPPLAAAAGRRPGAGLQVPHTGAQLPNSQPDSPSNGRPGAAAPGRQQQAGANARRKQQQQQQQQRDSDAGTSSPTSSSTLQSQQDDAAAAAAVHKPRQQAAPPQAGKPPSAQLSLRQRLGLPPVGPAGTALALPDVQAGVACVAKTKPPKNNHVVCVWDVDETLLLLHSLVTGRYAAASDSVEPQHAAQLGRKAQRLLLKLADDKMHFTQLEDVDLVHVSDVWRLAAHHVQRVSRRERQQQKEQGTASAAAAGSVTAGSSGSNGLAMQPGTTKDAARRSSGEGDAGKQPRTNGVQQAAAATGGSERDSERDSSAVPAAPAACNDAGGAAEAGADAAAAAATAAAAGSCVVVGARDLPPPRELVLRPVKPGPPPDVLKRMWEDIQQVYDAGSGLLALPKSEQAELDALYEELDAASSGWCRAAARLLGELQAGGGGGLVVTHVVVGGSQLVPLLAKLLLFRLDGFFGLQEVYAAAHAPKMAAFKRIATKYGPKARYIVLGDGLEEEACAEAYGWPFVRISLTPQPPLPAAPPAAPARGAASEPQQQQQQQRAGAGAAKRHKSSDDGANTGREQQAAGAAADDSEAPSDGGGDVSMGEAAAAGATGAEGDRKGRVRTRPDALASAGHTLLELTAEQLLQLAASQS